jgi:tRNA(Ile)-lysidine synthase
VVVAGVSGGPDSVALLHILHQLAESLRLRLLVAHLNHGARGDEASVDAEFVRSYATRLGWPCRIETIDVPALAEKQKLAFEEAARRARYAFLCRVAVEVGATHIAVGHHADDQAETVLMHLLRGAGPAGLRGMLPLTRMQDYQLLPFNGKPESELVLIRPLLEISRGEIEAYCREHALETRFDRSNLDTTYFRNRLRHEVLPYLAQLNPQISRRLCHLAEVVRADYQLLEELVDVACDATQVASYPDAIVYNLKQWREQPISIQRALIRCAAYQLRSQLREVDFVHVEQAVEIARKGHTGAIAVLPAHLKLTVGYTTLTIDADDALHLPAERPWLEPGEEIDITIPGITTLHDGWQLHTQVAKHWNTTSIAENPNPLAAWIDGDALGNMPRLRIRRLGDRFQPQGLKGAEIRLSEFLTNAKLPRPWRDYLPLLTAGERILWVTGTRLSHAACVRPDSTHVVYLRFRQPCGSSLCTPESPGLT